MKAVVIGAGRAGCGSVGYVLARARHQVVFVNRDPRVADRINRHRGYVVQVAENGKVRPERVDDVRALHLSDHTGVAAAIADADLVATAVGAANLGVASSVLAAGLSRSTTPKNVVAFENAIDAGPVLRQLTARWADAGSTERHGFASGLVLRIVADRTLDPDPMVPLTFVADAEHRLVVDNHGLAGDLPRADGLTGTDAYATWLRGKLFTLNAAHAAAGYLGYLKGYRYVHTSVRDPQIRQVVSAVARLGRDGLAARDGSLTGWPDPASVLRRLDNASLNDPIERVVRDPLRKLVPAERLTGAAAWAGETGLDVGPLALVIAAAIRFAHDRGLATWHAEQLVRDVCGLDPTRGTGRLVVHHAHRMSAIPDGALAVNLHRMSWAWRTARDGANQRSAA